ncbi:MAG: nitroreductase family protein [Gemmataceae bacterium]
MDALTVLMTRTSAAKLSEPGPEPKDIEKMLGAALRAPDHGRLHPWRFVLIEGDARKGFGELLAQSLLSREPSASEQKLEAERNKALRAPLIIAVAAEVKANPKVPETEQILAVAAAAQNILLAAHALGFGANWKTGAAAYDQAVKTALGLAPGAQLVGFLYIGSVAVQGRQMESALSDYVSHWPSP